MNRALEVARSTVGDPGAGQRLAAYYDPSTGFAGDLFLGLEPNDLDQITATDLYAISMLNVEVGVAGARALLRDESNVARTKELLSQLPDRTDLKSATSAQLRAASELHQHVRGCLGTNPWVVAAKLTARKRPWLIPVRDNVVTVQLLGLGSDFQVDWQVYAAIASDDVVAAALDDVVTQAEKRLGFRLTDPPLKLLDAVLWTGARAASNERS